MSRENTSRALAQATQTHILKPAMAAYVAVRSPDGDEYDSAHEDDVDEEEEAEDDVENEEEDNENEEEDDEGISEEKAEEAEKDQFEEETAELVLEDETNKTRGIHGERKRKDRSIHEGRCAPRCVRNSR